MDAQNTHGNAKPVRPEVINAKAIPVNQPPLLALAWRRLESTSLLGAGTLRGADWCGQDLWN